MLTWKYCSYGDVLICVPVHPVTEVYPQCDEKKIASYENKKCALFYANTQTPHETILLLVIPRSPVGNGSASCKKCKVGFTVVFAKQFWESSCIFLLCSS